MPPPAVTHDTESRFPLASLPMRTLSLFCVALVAVGAGCTSGEPPDRLREPGEEPFLRNIRQLTFGGQNAEAYFSRDGERLIFQRQVTTEGCDQQYVVNLDGSDLHLVSTGAGRTTCGYFYDGDDRILYSSTDHASDQCPATPDFSLGYVWALYDYDIYSARPDGSDRRVLFRSPGYDAEATLSGDGSRIVFTSMRDGDLDIYTMAPDGSDLVRLTDDLGYDGGPVFSPDGSEIVYRAHHPVTEEERADYRRLLARGLVRPSQMDIWIMHADGREKHQVTHLPGANFAPFFHPDGERIIFASNLVNPRGRDFDLYLVGKNGSGLTRVTGYDGFDGFPVFSPDSRKFVFASNRNGQVEGETNVFIADWIEGLR